LTYPTNEVELNLNNEGYKYIAGVDEVGRGPLAGPVLSCAIILPDDFYHPLLNDSKVVSKRNREILFDYINKAAISIGIGVVDNDKIDEINILEATKLSMELALNNLSIKPDFILTDYVKLNHDNLMAIKQGDRISISIAAASIIAKVLRDKMMDEYHLIYPEYDFINNKGYGTKNHILALEKYGPTKIHRKTFKKVL